MIPNTIEESKFDDEDENFETLLKDLKDYDLDRSHEKGIQRINKFDFVFENSVLN